MVWFMARLSRFVAVAVLLGGATVSLSACTGGSDPIASPSPPVSTVVTPSPSVAASPTPLTDDELLALIPENARAENFVSASNFAKFFVREYQRMFVERDPRLLSILSGPNCKFCQSAQDSFAQLETASQHREGGDVTIDPMAAVGGLQGDGTYFVTLPMSTGPTETRDAQGAVVGNSGGGSGLAAFSLRYSDAHWVVLGVNVQRSGE